ncbi:MAG: GH3 auxin-responsive promoter family protein [Bacteroidetes bacterium]|nr:GH3 auxin-responsive promoter family protein [Bacteroidota bacterium]
MGVKSIVAKTIASFVATSIYKDQKKALNIQHKLLKSFLHQAAQTDFGKEHRFDEIKSYEDYRQSLKICDYESLKNYIELIADGKKDVLWKGLPLYFCKSSGTTSGTKYIPVTSNQISAMITAARNALMMYISETGHADFFDHKMIFLQGSPELEKYGKIPTGRLSGIAYNHVPTWLHANRMPSYTTNCISDWEEKIEAIAKETLMERMSLISGIPPWVVMYFEKLRELSGKEFIKDIFPDFRLFAHGGVNYEPYRNRIETLIGEAIPTVETYPASEGFIAFQDSQTAPGLLLNVNGGIFYEFIKAEEIFRDQPQRIALDEVELDVNYAIILTTNAGLWAYELGDTIKFTSINPYRIIVTGRVKHFISAFGEHVIGEEVEQALLFAMRTFHVGVTEFTVAPNVSPTGEQPFHEWFIEFSKPPIQLQEFAKMMDKFLQEKNPYYFDLRKGNVVQQLKVRPLLPNAFANYMKSQGKLGGQNKVPRLINDRKIADQLEEWVLKE